MFLTSFQTTFGAIFELVLMGAMGFILVRSAFVSEAGLKTLSDLVIGLFLPLFMFVEITRRFSFSLYPDWWIYPLYSLVIAFIGYACGAFAIKMFPALTHDMGEFLGITTFQNSGYLPLPLVAALLPTAMAEEMFIYIFLFLLGFNMVIFSFGVVLLTKAKNQKFNFKNMFNAPVVATLLALAVVFFKASALLPELVLKPMESLGRCTIPLSILVVGGNLASLKNTDLSHLKALSSALVIKLLMVPALFLGFILLTKPQPLLGLLILLQAAMPPAALLSVISKNKNSGDHLISQAIFYGHLLSIVTVPLFLVLYWTLCGKPF
jgi:predicted permease